MIGCSTTVWRKRRSSLACGLLSAVTALTLCQLGAEERAPTGFATSLRITEFGLELANQRATSEPWTLDRSSNYQSSEDVTLREKMQQAYRMAQQHQNDGQPMVSLDMDLDGRADWWAFYAAGIPIFLETDRFGTGCHDLRVDLREKTWTAKEYHGWSHEPPVPLAFDSQPQIAFRDLYDWAGRSSLGDIRGSPLTQHNLGQVDS